MYICTAVYSKHPLNQLLISTHVLLHFYKSFPLTLDEKIALGLGALSNRLTLNTTGTSDTEGIL